MCGIGLATKGFICNHKQLVGMGGGGVIYRDRKPSQKFKFPKVNAELIGVIPESEKCMNVVVTFNEGA